MLQRDQALKSQIVPDVIQKGMEADFVVDGRNRESEVNE